MMLEFILSSILFFITFLFSEIDLFDKIWLSIPLLGLVLMILIYYNKPFIQKLRRYSLLSWLQLFSILLISISFWIRTFYEEISFNIIFLIVGISISVISSLLSLFYFFSYKNPFKITSPKIFRVPLSSRRLEFSIKNNLPKEQNIKIKLTFPENIKVKNQKKNYFNRQLSLKPKNKATFSVLLRSNLNNKQKTSNILLEFDGGKIYKKIVFIT